MFITKTSAPWPQLVSSYYNELKAFSLLLKDKHAAAFILLVLRRINLSNSNSNIIVIVIFKTELIVIVIIINFLFFLNNSNSNNNKILELLRISALHLTIRKTCLTCLHLSVLCHITLISINIRSDFYIYLSVS